MAAVIVMDPAAGADPDLAFDSEGRRDHRSGFKIQMLRQVQIIPQLPLRNGGRLVGLEHVGKGQPGPP